MKGLTRFGFAVAICLSGWAVAPFAGFPTQAIGWERFADAYSLIHNSVIPAAAVATGAEGAFFQTGVDVNNTSSGGEAFYQFWWLPRGQDNPSPRRSEVFSLEGGQSVRFENVLTEVFGLEPNRLGAVMIASDSDDVIAMSRTYNVSQNGGTTATFGQALPAVPADELIPSGQTRRIIFFSENSGTRGNLGCVNGTGSEIDILIDLYDAGGTHLDATTLSLGAWGNDQINRIFRDHEPVNGYVDVLSNTPGASYYCYGSVLDNRTSDPTTILPQRPTSGTTYFVSAAALASGATGSFFQTDVDINNNGSAASFVFKWLPRGEDNSTPLQSMSYSIGAGRSVRFENVLSEVFSLAPDAAGAITIEASSNRLLVMSRTYNVVGNGSQGSFGQAIPGVQEGDLIRPGERRRIIFLSQNGELRSNVGCVNATDEDIDIDIEVYDDSGNRRTRLEMELDPWSNDQINRILQPFAPINGYVDVSSDTSGGLFYCYGSLLDNATSDPTTIGPR
jgi:hypothetical protein